MIKNRPRGGRFHQWLLSRKQHTVCKQITVGQFIGDQIIVMISKAMIVYIGITSKISRPTPTYIYYYYSTHRPLSSMRLVYSVHGETEQCNKNDDMMQTRSIHVGIDPILLYLIAMINTCLAAPSVTGKEHHTIEPITKHLFPWQEKLIQSV